jgi:hypothetical protein
MISQHGRLPDATHQLARRDRAASIAASWSQDRKP